MKLLVVTHYFWPENFRINDLVSEWVKRGHEVTVITGKPNYPLGVTFEAYINDPADFQEFSGATVLRVPMLARGQGAVRLFLNYLSFVLGASIWGSWRLRGCSFDAIFVYEPSPVTVGLPAVIFGRLKRAPVLFWVLDLWPETLAALGVVRSPFLIRMIGGMVRFIYQRCTMVLGQSRSFLPSIAKYCSDQNKIRYFPSWSEDLFSIHADGKAAEIAEAPEVFTVLFAGNIGEAQDLPAVLDAVERLKAHGNIRWVIVGDGRKSDWVSAEVIRRKLEKNILLAGRFPV
ncbi:MAG: glycosyltransferase family 4 protein, partial [Candidatus Marinimicrobia bacterium]|nr:glycosyltransferase family 4 protein [Candidatus Neomarinimicrobiota bacterium]MBT4946947.1 glycosyltransferase family 4 protein [Candidatus Neomarinimicrobiota bacterium]